MSEADVRIDNNNNQKYNHNNIFHSNRLEFDSLIWLQGLPTAEQGLKT